MLYSCFSLFSDMIMTEMSGSATRCISTSTRNKVRGFATTESQGVEGVRVMSVAGVCHDGWCTALLVQTYLLTGTKVRILTPKQQVAPCCWRLGSLPR